MAVHTRVHVHTTPPSKTHLTTTGTQGTEKGPRGRRLRLHPLAYPTVSLLVRARARARTRSKKQDSNITGDHRKRDPTSRHCVVSVRGLCVTTCSSWTQLVLTAMGMHYIYRMPASKTGRMARFYRSHAASCHELALLPWMVAHTTLKRSNPHKPVFYVHVGTVRPIREQAI